MIKSIGLLCLTTVLAAAIGCSSKATAPPSGFLQDYSRLVKANDGAMRFVSPDLKNYSAFMVDPVGIRVRRDPPKLKPEEQAEVARYFNESFAKVLTNQGYRVVDKPDVGVARVRIALTDINESTWWMNIHPASKLSGAGTGGASMEGEVVDSVTGKQLAAVIQSGRGSQFEIDTFNKLDDVKDAIDTWAKAAGQRLNELHGKSAPPAVVGTVQK